MNPVDLERLTARTLGGLPQPRAPYTLLPRVMAAVQAWALRPWYRRAWHTWPLGWQVAAMTLLAAGSALAMWSAQAVEATMSGVVSGVASDLGGMLQNAASTTRVVLALARALVEPALFLRAYVLALVVLMCAACAAVAAALNRVALGRTWQS